MFKIIENNQIIDVMDTIKFIKYLPRSKKIIAVDQRQANGCVASSGNEIYHIYGTPYTFEDLKRTISFIQIDEEEYNQLTTQLKENQKLASRVQYLEQKLLELEKLLKG